MRETRYYATINGRYCKGNDLNAEVSNIKCPICRQKMDIVQIEDNGRKCESYNRELNERGHLIQNESWSHAFNIKWWCKNCTAELSATAKQIRETSIDLDADL